MSQRLPSHLEASTLRLRAETVGGFAHVLHRGDADRGVLVLLIAEKGAPVALLERQMGNDFSYRWARFDHPTQDMRSVIGDRSRIDPDFWLIELDVPDAERFIAETTELG